MYIQLIIVNIASVGVFFSQITTAKATFNVKDNINDIIKNSITLTIKKYIKFKKLLIKRK